jgi:biopolymer transport protein ExbB
MKSVTKRLALMCFAALVACATLAPAMAQEEKKEGAAAAGHSNKSLLDLYKEGGWVMHVILIASIGTAYLVWEGVNRTALKKCARPEDEESLKQLFRQGDYTGAYDYCKQNPNPMTNVLRSGISMLGEGKQMSEEAMIGELHKEQGYISNFISYLSVIGVCTPMIGLVGTVTGMMKAFEGLGAEGVGNPASLSAAIGEVLVATASGLFIAIPAFIAYYVLRNRMSKLMHHIQDVMNDLFRKMPYDALAGANIGDEELYAALPAWATGAAPVQR